MVMRANKVFTVIVYDICDNKRRNNIAKLLRQYGSPVNLSVFECMLSERQLMNLAERICQVIDTKHDKVVYYRMCMNCYTKILYQPDNIRKTPEISGFA